MLLDVLSSAALIIFYSDTTQIKLNTLQFVLKFIKIRNESKIYDVGCSKTLFTGCTVLQKFRSHMHICHICDFVL